MVGMFRYCTGGVRCELASAYLRSKGREFEDVYQVIFSLSWPAQNSALHGHSYLARAPQQVVCGEWDNVEVAVWKGVQDNKQYLCDA
jgi:hypothetical protein